MPLYNYSCKNCGGSFELMLSVNMRVDPINNPCPDCGMEKSIELLVLGAPSIGYHYSGNMRHSDNFNDRLKEIKKHAGKDNTLHNTIR